MEEIGNTNFRQELHELKKTESRIRKEIGNTNFRHELHELKKRKHGLKVRITRMWQNCFYLIPKTWYLIPNYETRILGTNYTNWRKWKHGFGKKSETQIIGTGYTNWRKWIWEEIETRILGTNYTNWRKWKHGFGKKLETRILGTNYTNWRKLTSMKREGVIMYR